MIRVDGAYLYDVAEKLRTLDKLEDQDTDRLSLFMQTYGARQELHDLIFSSVFASSFVTVRNSARDLLNQLEVNVPQNSDDVDWSEVVAAWQITALKASFRNFETILRAELQSIALYHVSPKGGFNTFCLIDSGETTFPPDLAAKVPDAIPDILAATRCIAFELPTAAAFHLHRANESVLRVYWDNVTNGNERPSVQNMGVYLNELNKQGVGRKEVREHLKSIKDLHRNPLMHPEQTMDSVEQAIDLMAAIRCSIGYMLRDIPHPLS